MGSQAKVTLTALNPDFVTPNERVIILTPECPHIPIGRASKSLSKGLQGAVDNAWFDSPVMSRDHAEISMNFEDNSITIRDIGSMHGTRLNGSLLDTQSPTSLEDGDIVVFGAEVKRGPETFPACSFRITYEILPHRPANTFAFPESSELDDEEEYELSDEEDLAGHYNNISSDDGTSIVSSTRKMSQPVASVDLTRDESPVDPSRNVVDLTGETPAEGRILGMMAGRPADINNNPDPVSIGLYAGRPPIVIESEDDGDFSTDSESDSDHESLDAATPIGFSLNDLDDTDDDEDEDEAESVSEAAQARPLDNLVQYAEETMDNSKMLLFDENADLETSEGESDDQSDLGLSEAGTEGIKALFANNLLSSEVSVPFSFESPQDEGNEEAESDLAPKHISFESLMDPNSAHSTNITAANTTAQHFLGGALSRPSQILRQPSPSDAAMVKTATLPQHGTSPHTAVSVITEVGSSSAQKLGEKSGKVAYFKAREVNKANFQRMEDNEVGETSQPISARATSRFSTAPVVCMLEGRNDDGNSSTPVASTLFSKSAPNEFSKPSRSTTMSTSLTASDMPTREQCAFLDSADQNLFPIREASPLPDMTSAVVYNNSKETMAAAAASNIRSGIKIKDIIESTLSPQTSIGNKRKADDISEASDAELRTWAKNPASHVPSVPTSNPTFLTEEIDDQRYAKQDEAPISAPSDIRPTKKQRVLESVGYIALGGVTAVAGLFAALVATAPEF